MSRPVTPEILAALEQQLADPTAAAEAARKLLSIYEEANEIDKILGALEVLAQRAPETTERATALKRAAELCSQRGDRKAAVAHLRACLEGCPQDVEALQTLRRMHRMNQEWAALVEVLERLGATPSEPAVQLAAWREAAELHEARLFDKESACACWRQLVVRDPKDREALSALERIATELERSEELSLALRGHLDLEGFGTPKGRELAFRLLRLTAERLCDWSAALQLGRDLLAAEPDHAEVRALVRSRLEQPGSEGALALRALDPALATSGEHRERLALRKQRLPIADQEEQRTLHLEIAALHEKELGEPEFAFMAMLNAFNAGFDREALLPELERLAEETDSQEELAEILESAAEELPASDESAAPLWRAAARLREATDEPAAAAELWRTLLAGHPDDVEALDRVAALYERLGDSRRLAEVCARRARLSRDPAERAATVLRAALAHEAAGDLDSALAALLSECADEGAPTPLLEALERLLGRAGRTAPQADVLLRLAGRAPDAEAQAGLWLRRARLLEGAGDGKGALGAFGRALALAPDSDGAIEGLERLVERDDTRRDALGLLASLWRDRDAPQRLAGVIEARLEDAPSQERPALWRELASLRERLGELPAAMAAWMKAFAESPEDPELLAELERVAQAAGALEELAGALEDRLERGVSPALAARLWAKVGALYDRLGRYELSARAWTERARGAPEDADALKALAEACRRTSAHRALVDTLQKLASLQASSEGQAGLLFEAAGIAEETLGDRALAATCYRRVLERTPGDRGALRSLRRVLEGGGDWGGSADLLEREIAECRKVSAAADARDLQVELSRLRLERLGEPRAALATAAEVVAADPAHRGAIELLEELAQLDGAVRDEAMKLLEPLLEASGGHAKLVEHLETQLRAEPSPARRAELWRRVAVLRAGPGQNPEAGFLAATSALREAIEVATLELCARLAGEADCEEELVALLEELAEDAEPSEKPALLRTLVKLHEEGDDAEELERTLSRLVAADPADLEAFTALEARYVTSGRLAARADLMRRRLPAVGAGPDRAALLVRIADAEEAAGRKEAAVEALREAFALDQDPRLLRNLDRLLGSLGRYAEQAEVLARLARVVTDGEEGKRCLLQCAQALVRAGTLEAAVAAYGSILERWPGDATAVEALEPLAGHETVRAEVARLLEPVYRKRGAPGPLAEALEQRLETASPAERARLLREIAALRESLGDSNAAFGALRRVFAENPEDAEARAGLQRAAEAAGALEDLAAAFEDQLDRGGSDALRLELRRAIARLYAGPLDKPVAAAQAWEEVARLLPADPEPLRALAALHRTQQMDSDLAPVLMRLAQVEPAPEGRRAALLEAARVARERLEDSELAVECYERLLEQTPDDLEALEALDDVLAGLNRHADRVRGLERRVELERRRGQPRRLAESRLALARLFARELSDRGGALRELVGLLDAEPSDAAAIAELETLALTSGDGQAEAAERVEPLLERAGELGRLARVLEAHARVIERPADRAALLSRAARIGEASFEDPGRAFLSAGQALREAPGNAQCLALCVSLAAKADAREELCALLEEIAPDAPAESRPELFRTLAREQEQGGEEEEAAGHWQLVLAALPRDEEALERIEALLAKAGRAAEAVPALRARLDLAADARERRAVLARIARAHEAAGADAAAAEALLQALAPEPTLEILVPLERVLARLGRHDEQAEVLAQLARLSPSGEARGFGLARAEALARSDKPEAAVAAFGELLERWPDEENAVAGLERLLGSGTVKLEAARLLERRYREKGDAVAEAEVLDLQVDAAAPAERERLLRRLAELRERLGEKGLAFDALRRLLPLAPSDGELLGAFERLGRETASLEEVAAHYRERLEAGDAPAVALGARLAALLDRDLGRPDEAARCWEEVLQREPEHAEALLALSRIHRSAGRDRDYAAALQRQAAGERDPVRRAELLVELADVAERRLADRALAIRACRDALGCDPARLPAAERLERLLEQAEDWAALRGRLEDRVARAREAGDRTSELALAVRLAELCREHLADPATALSLLADVVGRAPGHPEATRGLERLLASQGPERARAGALLEPIYAASDNAERLAESLEAQAEAARGSEKAALLRRAAALQADSLGSPRLAFAAIGRALAETPEDAALLELCRGYAERAGDLAAFAALLDEIAPRAASERTRARLFLALADAQEARECPEQAFAALLRAWREAPERAALEGRLETLAGRVGADLALAAAWEETLDLVPPSEQARLALELARLVETRLGALDRAAALSERARRADPAAEPAALAMLERLLEQLERWTALASVLDALVEREPQPAGKVARLLRLGALCRDRIADPERAIACYERALSVDGLCLQATRELEALYEAEGRIEDLVKVLERQTNLTAGGEREAVIVKRARLSAERLRDPARAVALYKEVLAANPANEAANAGLYDLYEADGRYAELRALLEAKIARTLEPRELAALHERLALLLWRRLGAIEQAAAHFRAALDRDPKRVATLTSLWELLESQKRDAELIGVLRRVIPLAEGTADAQRARLKLAELLSQAGVSEEALEVARRAFAAGPHDETALDRLRAIFLRLDAVEDAAQVLEARAAAQQAAGATEEALATWLEVAALRERGADELKAAPALERVLQLQPSHRGAYEQAAGLYGRNRRWREYAELTEAFLPHFADDAERLAALRELANLWQERLRDDRAAFRVLRAALRLAPGDEGIREKLEKLSAPLDAAGELAESYRGAAAALGSGPAWEAIGLALARLLDAALDDAAGAERALREVLAQNPSHAAAHDTLAAMFERRGAHRALVTALLARAEIEKEAPSRRAALRRAARVLDQKLNDGVEAARALQRALEAGADLETAKDLVELHRRRKQWSEAASAMLLVRDLAPTPAERARVQLDIAELQERLLQDEEAAIASYRQALELDRKSQPALDALERLYTRQERSLDLLRVLETKLELTRDRNERIALLGRCAALLEERLDDRGKAETCLEQVLSLDAQNLAALKSLERVRRARGRWAELVTALERHLPLSPSSTEQIAVTLELGEVCRDRLEDLPRAISWFQRVLDVDPSNRPALKALFAAHEKRRDFKRAAEVLEREARVTTGAEAVALYARLGTLCGETLCDLSRARQAWQQARRADPTHLPAIRALRAIHEQERDWAGYERMLVEESEHTPDPAAKGEAQLRVAQFYANRRKDEGAARRWYESALKLLPGSVEAARPLADLALARQDWATAETMLDLVVQKLRSVPEARGDLARAALKLGHACHLQGKLDKALEAFRRAAEAGPEQQEALQGLADVLFEAARFPEALDACERLLTRHAEQLTHAAMVELHCRTGQIHRALARPEAARAAFQKAVAIAPAHAFALRSLVEIAETSGDWRGAADWRGRLVRAVEGAERFEACVALARLARDRLGDAELSIESFLKALEVEPESIEVMEELAAAYRAGRQWHKAAKLLQTLATHSAVKDPDRRKRSWLALGQIAAQELGDVERAAGAFDAALDIDPRFNEAFAALETLLSGQKRWKQLDDAFVRMIKRLPQEKGTAAARAGLWRSLGDLRAKLLKNPAGALDAYQAGAEIAPDDAGAQESLAVFAAGIPGKEALALQAWRRALPHTTEPVRSCEAIAELLGRQKDPDGLFLAEQVLVGLFGIGDERRRAKLLETARRQAPATRPVNDLLWRTHLLHPLVKGPVGEIFSILNEKAGEEWALSPSKFGVNPKKHALKELAAESPSSAAKRIEQLAGLLDMKDLEIYSPYLASTLEKPSAWRLRTTTPDEDLGLEVCQSQPVFLKVGARYLREQDELTLICRGAFAFAMARPEVGMALRMEPERLEAVLQAAVSLFTDRFPFTAEPKAMKKERKVLEKRLDDSAMVALRTVMREYLERARPDDLRDYFEGVALTGWRVALFAAGEFGPLRQLALDEGLPRRIPEARRNRDLMLFALGGDLAALRAAVGRQVK